MSRTGERRASEWMYECISVAVMQGNEASIISCTPDEVTVHPHSQCDVIVHKALVGMSYMLLGIACASECWGWHGVKYRHRARLNM